MAEKVLTLRAISQMNLVACHALMRQGVNSQPEQRESEQHFEQLTDSYADCVSPVPRAACVSERTAAPPCEQCEANAPE
jgi:hypothetical protein